MNCPQPYVKINYKAAQPVTWARLNQMAGILIQNVPESADSLQESCTPPILQLALAELFPVQ